MYYKTRSTDTLSKLAKKFSLPENVLKAFNPHVNGSLYTGDLIKVPNLEDIPADAAFLTGVTKDAIIKKAKSAINKGIRYKLGMGGTNPSAKLPDQHNQCDCSGFVCWALGLNRKTDIPFYKKFGGWIFTDSMVADINSNAGIFEKLNTPVAGCIVVYGAGAQIGHVGIVSEVAEGKMKKVIHCSSGNDKTFKDAIQETVPTVFDRADSFWGKYTDII
ncbi:peptidoglycan-binding protein [Niastella koreensis]|uniref:Peptidoglycan-binding lysin domain protein n=2 Tax=Niastella koreensis TaxID=354356 RepID=G8TPM9_NIAKG|nr:CHAP domain-containing protein [Niastella koreensis]AEV98862.1 Peptidoglycan-binding lysin domain protein [Niastella koreensis GR20-10]OQP43792.1 peptidoglycan-binding protein [Niastella koreensis]